MAYSLKPSDRTIEAGIRRIAADQLDRAVAALDDVSSGNPPSAAIHEARKKIKKTRALIRIVRPVFSGYAEENVVLRDAAREISGFRTQSARIETLDRLLARYGAVIDEAALAPLRDALVDACRTAEADPDVADRVAAARTALVRVRSRSETWAIGADGFDALGPGLGKTWKRARTARAKAAETRRAEDLHAWRKRVKYHWYHARLLKRIWRRGMAPHVAAASLLADRLGEHHDLVDLAPAIRACALSDDTARAVEGLVAADRRRLEDSALALGTRLLADRPKALRRRWKIWYSAQSL